MSSEQTTRKKTKKDSQKQNLNATSDARDDETTAQTPSLEPEATSSENPGSKATKKPLRFRHVPASSTPTNPTQPKKPAKGSQTTTTDSPITQDRFQLLLLDIEGNDIQVKKMHDILEKEGLNKGLFWKHGIWKEKASKTDTIVRYKTLLDYPVYENLSVRVKELVLRSLRSRAELVIEEGLGA